ncbi:hypothetical protein LCGC14_1818390 [marine sediment metagenome]|uniref:HNH nuclease domain-containing protein n=1 Tax=marine sediment metagenome TaxID=412755 RepID=A0A0F9IZF3_9ZZZZ
MLDLDVRGIRNLLGAMRGERFRAKSLVAQAFIPPSDALTASDAIEAPLGDYYICHRRAKGYPSFCKVCQARCSRVAFEDKREIVVANLEKYCQARPAPSAQHRLAQIVGNQRYFARKRGAKGRVTAKEWRTICESYGGRCAYCGSPGSTQDHVVPISRGGTHTADNVVPACSSCNSRKHDKVILKKGQFLLSF